MMQLKALQIKKTPGYDGIDNRAAKSLPRKGVLALVKTKTISLLSTFSKIF